MSKNHVFSHFLGNATLTFFIFCMIIEANSVQHLGWCSSGLDIQSQKNDPGINRGLNVKKSGVLSFLWNSTIILFYFLHDDKSQHCATSGPGIGFQKR